MSYCLDVDERDRLVATAYHETSCLKSGGCPGHEIEVLKVNNEIDISIDNQVFTIDADFSQYLVILLATLNSIDIVSKR